MLKFHENSSILPQYHLLQKPMLPVDRSFCALSSPLSSAGGLLKLANRFSFCYAVTQRAGEMAVK
jgi:hypothetical protein